MADRKDVEAGKAHVTIRANSDPLEKTLKGLTSQFAAWGNGIMAVGAGIMGIGSAIVAAFAPALYIFSSLGGQLADMSARTGVAAASLAELKFAAEQSGTSLETVEKALLKMGKQGLDPKKFDQYAATVNAISSDSLKIAKAMELWGKSGAELIPMLGELQELRAEARRLGLVPTAEAVSLAAKFGDVFDKLMAVIDAAMFNIGAAVAPVLLPIMETMVEISASASRWIQQNAELVQTIGAIGLGLVVVGSLIVGIGAALVTVAALITAISTIAAFIATPVGAIVVAVVAVGAALAVAAAGWFIFTEQGRRTANAIMAAFKPVFDFFSRSIKGIATALMAGEFKLAWEITAQTFKVLMFQAIDSVFNYFIERIGELLQQMGPLAGGIGAEIAKELEFMRGVSGDATRLEAKQLETLLKRAKSPSSGGPDGSTSGYLEELKSLGSFNAQALTMQNWGKMDPQKKMEALAKAAMEANVAGHEATRKAIENSGTYGE